MFTLKLCFIGSRDTKTQCDIILFTKLDIHVHVPIAVWKDLEIERGICAHAMQMT